MWWKYLLVGKIVECERDRTNRKRYLERRNENIGRLQLNSIDQLKKKVNNFTIVDGIKYGAMFCAKKFYSNYDACLRVRLLTKLLLLMFFLPWFLRSAIYFRISLFFDKFWLLFLLCFSEMQTFTMLLLSNKKNIQQIRQIECI